jgi:hypothetical protein
VIAKPQQYSKRLRLERLNSPKSAMHPRGIIDVTMAERQSKRAVLIITELDFDTPTAAIRASAKKPQKLAPSVVHARLPESKTR